MDSNYLGGLRSCKILWDEIWSQCDDSLGAPGDKPWSRVRRIWYGEQRERKIKSA